MSRNTFFRSAAPPLVLLALLFLLPLPATAADEHPGSILRVRGGFVHDPDHDPGSGWSAGGAVGHFVGRSVLLTLNYDHIHMSSKAPTMNTIRPITAQVELGMPWKRGIRPRLGFGAGVYFREKVGPSNLRTFTALSTAGNPQDAFVYPTEYMRDSSQPFGLNVGGGASAPLTGNTLLDLDIRFHQVTNRSSILGIFGLGISYMWH